MPLTALTDRVIALGDEAPGAILGRGFTPAEIQAFLYYLHGAHMVARGVPLVDEPFRAWADGVALPSVHQRLLPHDGAPVPLTARRSARSAPGEHLPAALSALVETTWQGLYHAIAGGGLMAHPCLTGHAWQQARAMPGPWPEQGPALDDAAIAEDARRARIVPPAEGEVVAFRPGGPPPSAIG